MKAVVWHGTEDLRVDEVPDPTIQEPTDAIVRITSTAICGSDLHLYAKLGLFMTPGDIIGHEPMGIVEEVGSQVSNLKPGDRVVVPFNISCGHCWMCDQHLYSQCETTQVKQYGKGAGFFGYTKLYGGVPGGQAEYLRVPQAQFGPVKVPEGPPDFRFLYLSDVLPTAWQAVAYADIPQGGSVAVFGLGPIGQMCVRIARHQGAERVFAVDLQPERLDLARRYGAEVINYNATDDVVGALFDLTSGRGPDSAIDAVGMEASGSRTVESANSKSAELVGSRVVQAAESALSRVGLGGYAEKAENAIAKGLGALNVQQDQSEALRLALNSVRRGGTVSLTGVYVAQINGFPLGELFDRQIQLRMGQANVRHWTDKILPLLSDADPLGTQDLATHVLPLAQAPHGYEIFQKKQDNCIKVVLQP